MQSPTLAQLLSKRLETAQRRNSRYSIRALAQQLCVSHSTISRIIAGKLKPSLEFESKIRAKLESITQQIAEPWTFTCRYALPATALSDIQKSMRRWEQQAKSAQIPTTDAVKQLEILVHFEITRRNTDFDAD